MKWADEQQVSGGLDSNNKKSRGEGETHADETKGSKQGMQERMNNGECDGGCADGMGEDGMR